MYVKHGNAPLLLSPFCLATHLVTLFPNLSRMQSLLRVHIIIGKCFQTPLYNQDRLLLAMIFAKEYFRKIKSGVQKSVVEASVWKEKHAMGHKRIILEQS